MPRGRVDVVLHTSNVLAENPLGDPIEREVGVYLPPSYDGGARRYPVVLVLPGYTGTGLALVARGGWVTPLDRRMDALVADGRAHEAILVLPDCFTRYGGSQYVDSPAIGRYATYLCDELVPLIDARYRTLAERAGRGVVGKSSGGWGALHLAMTRPELFAAAASHAGDCAFDVSYRRELPIVAAALDRDGGVEGFLQRFESSPARSSSDFEAMSILCCAAAWSPTRGPFSFGHGFELPMDLRTGVLRPDVWSRWLAFDPLHRLDDPRAVEALKSLRLLFLDAGKSDEYALQLGARQVCDALTKHAIPHIHEEFPGGHRNTAHRYERSLELVTHALGT
jgi:enterochelin esterase family protein